MDLSRVAERGEEWKITGLKTVVLKTAGNIEKTEGRKTEGEESGVEESVIKDNRAGWKGAGWKGVVW